MYLKKRLYFSIADPVQSTHSKEDFALDFMSEVCIQVNAVSLSPASQIGKVVTKL